MKHLWFFVTAFCFPLALFAQTDTVRIIRAGEVPERTEVREQRFAAEVTPDSQTTDSLVRVEVTTIQYFTDTLTSIVLSPDSVAKQREEVIKTDSADRRGHYIEAHVGLGYGSLGYQLSGAQNYVNGSLSALLQLQYAYFFHPNWGVGAGLWFTNYTSNAHIGGTYRWLGQTDTDYETNYDHSSKVIKWHERETIHNLGIPISLQFQMMKEDWKVGLFAAVGIAPSFSVSKRYKVVEGEIDHWGYYPKWNLTLTDMHEFGVKDYKDAPQSKGKMSVRPQATFFADLGVLVPLTKQIDMLLGGYVNVSMNDANKSDKQDIGWRDETFTFMNEYKGAYALTNAGKSHPWEVGFKIGVHWHYIAPDKHEMEDYFEYFAREVRDTNYVHRIDTIVIARADTTFVPVEEDTIVPANIRQVAEEVEKFNKIYFAFDSYQLTNKAKFYLNSIIDALNREPDAKIMLDGHASTEGQDAYNDILSENRARSVRNYLGSHGVDKNRIVTAGHGSRIPNEDHEREEMRRDRRVEIKVVYNENVVNEQ